MEGVALQGKIQRILAMLSPEYFNYKDNVLLEYEQQGRKQSLLSKNMKIDYLQTFSFPGGTVVKNMPVNAEDVGSTLGGEETLEKEMATHSSILAWKIPWTEQPGGLQSMGSQRVEHDSGLSVHEQTFYPSKWKTL